MTAGTIERASSRDSVHNGKACGLESKSFEREGGAEYTSRLNMLWARLGDGFNRGSVPEDKTECKAGQKPPCSRIGDAFNRGSLTEAVQAVPFLIRKYFPESITVGGAGYTSRQNLPWERLGDGFNRGSLAEELVRRPVARCLSELLHCKEACSPPSNDDELIWESSSEDSCDEKKSCQAWDHTVCQTKWPSSVKRAVKSSKRCHGFSVTPVPQECTDDIDSVESIEEFSGESGIEKNSNTPLKKVNFKAQWLSDMNKTPCSSEKSSQHQPWDSVVKKKRFLRGHLAERLTQLQTRERSAFAFWRHNRTSVTEPAEPPLRLTVLRMHIECSMIVALCSIKNAIESDPQSTLGSSTVIHTLQEDNHQTHSGSPTFSQRISVPHQSAALTQQACRSSSFSDPRPAPTLVALFTCETARRLNLQLGCIVRVSPPWLLLPGRLHPTLLSTNFSEREVGSPSDRPNTPLALLPRINATPGLPLSIAPVSGLTRPVVGAYWVPSLVPSTPPGPDSLLEAMETGRSGGVALRAVVQRVYPLGSAELAKTHRLTCTPAMDPHIPRLALLLQDGFGLFAELPISSLSGQSFASALLEGRLCMFNDLQVVKRTTRERSPSLFTLIHSLGDFQQQSLLHIEHSDSQAPSFCYLLSRHQDKDKIWPLSTTPSHLYSPPAYFCLRDILKVGEMQKCYKYEGQFSCMAAVHLARKLYLMDRSLVLLVEAETGEDPFTQPELDFVSPTTQEDTLCIVQGILSEEFQATSQSQMMSSNCKNCSLHRNLLSRDGLGQGLVCEVLLSCSSHPSNFLVRVQLTTCQECDVKSYLGREVGPIHCMVLPRQLGGRYSLCLIDIRLRTETGSQCFLHLQEPPNVT